MNIYFKNLFFFCLVFLSLIKFKCSKIVNKIINALNIIDTCMFFNKPEEKYFIFNQFKVEYKMR